MTAHVHHALKLGPTPDERERQAFVSTLRAHVLNAMADAMRQRFASRTAPGLPPGANSRDVLAAMVGQPYFQFYTATRVAAQEMVWASVTPTVERERARLAQDFRRLAGARAAGGSLTLDPGLAIPSYVASIDVHHMPGSYSLDAGEDDLAAGSLYDNGLSIFSFGLMGETLDDIGRSIAHWLTRRFPDFRPDHILDLGCSVGHQTLPWALSFPHARVTGIDVAPAMLRYAHARAEALGIEAHFLQADATTVPLPDASQDFVFSSMFLHELPQPAIRAVYAEAYRLLRPGGLMLHYELPPNELLDPYDGFYLDWDSRWNAEPFYQGYRDLDPRELARDAGFAPEAFVEASIPSLGFYGEEAVDEAAAQQGALASDRLGRLADGVQWYVHGAWKETLP